MNRMCAFAWVNGNVIRIITKRMDSDEDHWLIFTNGNGIKSQGVRIITMLKRSQMWITLITEDGAVTQIR